MAGDGAEMKNKIQKRYVVTMILLLAILVGCLPMSEEQINTKAEDIYLNLSKPEQVEGKDDKRADKRNLAQDQSIQLSGRAFTSPDPTLATYQDWLLSNQVFYRIDTL